ncbi:sulfotransferase domain-containing protein [Coleofasciculus sp. F4-SAH-05]|uniref:sulfotransferase domain-containing protein n=1 Tax=Coleofasciculus sp. F4-SAH-05 TaxID=3069525 RepID=UPI0032FE662B
MTTIYLHIGTHKTGTTTLQKFLSSNRQKLLEKRVLYPSSPDCHHKLLQNKGKDKPWGLNLDEWKYLIQEIKSENPEKIVVSSENFCRLYFEDVHKVKDNLSGYNTKIIVYIRRQDDYFASLYCQAIKTAHHWDRLKKHISDNKTYDNYYQMLEPWKQAFGKENLIIRVYEKEQLSDGLLNDFLKSIHITSEGLDFKKAQQTNISPSIRTIKIIQLLSDIAIGKMSISKKKMTGLYYTYLIPDTNLSRLIANLPDFLLSNELMTTQERVDILKEFEESNRKVAQEYLGRPDGQLFYSTPIVG